MRKLIWAVALPIVLLVTGCMQVPLCTRDWTVAHPTMTPEEILIGQDARVRAESEGAKGNLGAGQTYSY